MPWVAAMRGRDAGVEEEDVEWNSTAYIFHHFAIQRRVMRQSESQLSHAIRGTSYVNSVV